MEPEEKNIRQSSVPVFSWGIEEYPHFTRSTDWYWGFGLIVLALFGGALFYGNFLFAVVILMSAFTLVLFIIRKPKIVLVEITNSGITIDKKRHLFSSLTGFWISYEDEENLKLLFKSEKKLLPYIVIPIPDDIHEEELKKFLLEQLPEEELKEPFTEKLMENIGI